MKALGLGANWRQFALLVLVNAFVGAMVGLERAILPLIAEAEFRVASASALLSFVATFGLVKAFANLAAGHLADRVGRKPVLVAGWLAALPVPLLLMWAPHWGWIVFANALLGVNQGLCWSTTVIMKVDLAGPARRGLATGLNEAAGYVAVSLTALATGYLAVTYGLRPVPFYPGLGLAVLGLALSAGFVRETRDHARVEAAVHAGGETRLPFRRVLARTSWSDRGLFAASQAGLVNNLNDGIAWGLVPVFLAAAGLSLDRLAVVAALYPAVWGLGQLGTGPLSDRWGRKWLIAVGLWVQAIAITAFVLGGSYGVWLGAAALLGLGTALVYPTLLAAVSDLAHPSWRASAVGVYRLWRDGGYAVGAVAAGLVADVLDVSAAIAAVGALTLLSGVIVARVMPMVATAARNPTLIKG